MLTTSGGHQQLGTADEDGNVIDHCNSVYWTLIRTLQSEGGAGRQSDPFFNLLFAIFQFHFNSIQFISFITIITTSQGLIAEMAKDWANESPVLEILRATVGGDCRQQRFVICIHVVIANSISHLGEGADGCSTIDRCHLSLTAIAAWPTRLNYYGHHQIVIAAFNAP